MKSYIRYFDKLSQKLARTSANLLLQMAADWKTQAVNEDILKLNTLACSVTVKMH